MMFAVWSKENGGGETDLPSVHVPCYSLVVSAEVLAISKLLSTNYAQSTYPVLCN